MGPLPKRPSSHRNWKRKSSWRQTQTNPLRTASRPMRTFWSPKWGTPHSRDHATSSEKWAYDRYISNLREATRRGLKRTALPLFRSWTPLDGVLMPLRWQPVATTVRQWPLLLPWLACHVSYIYQRGITPEGFMK